MTVPVPCERLSVTEASWQLMWAKIQSNLPRVDLAIWEKISRQAAFLTMLEKGIPESGIYREAFQSTVQEWLTNASGRLINQIDAAMADWEDGQEQRHSVLFFGFRRLSTHAQPHIIHTLQK